MQIDESVNILVGSVFIQINPKLCVGIEFILWTVLVGRCIRTSRDEIENLELKQYLRISTSTVIKTHNQKYLIYTKYLPTLSQFVDLYMVILKAIFQKYLITLLNLTVDQFLCMYTLTTM